MPGVIIKGSLQRTKDFISSYGAGGKPLVVPMLDEVGEESVQFMQNIIMTTPSGIVEGKPDRYWTGRMYRAVSYKIDNPSRAVYRLVVGWVKDQADYFRWQDTGNPQSDGQWKIKGMHMVNQGRVFAREQTRRELARLKSRNK